MDRLVTADEAEKILKEHLGTIKLIMQESLEEVNRAMGAISVPLNSRSKCSLLHNIATEKAVKYFVDAPHIIIKKKYQSIQLIFSNRLVARIKKVNKDNLCRNAKTNRNQAILAQECDLFGPIIPITYVDLGYNVDFVWTELERLVVVCRLFNSIKWHIDFTDVEKAISPIVSKPAEQINVKNETQIKLRRSNE